MTPPLAARRAFSTRMGFAQFALANAFALPQVVAFASVLAACLPVNAQVAALDLPAIQPVLSQLDELYAKGDVAGYLASFEPDHPGAHAQLRQQLLRGFAPGVPLRRTSTFRGPPHQIGERTVVRVHYEVRAADGRSDALYVHDALLALRTKPGAMPVPTFCVEVPTEFALPANNLFRCPACNYQLGGVDGWLCVPQRNDRAQALEAASFYLIGTDIACDLSVRIDDLAGDNYASSDNAMPAVAVVERMAEALRKLDPTARPGIAVPWLPANHPQQAATTGTQIAGARLGVELPADRATPEGSSILLHAVTLGALQHLMLVRGGRRSLQQHASAVTALLNSYRMLDVDCDRAVAAARPLQHHTGGQLAENVYRNTQWNLELSGPTGWAAGLRCGGNLFRVAWSSPQGGRLWLLGYATPAGLTRWCRETADLWFREMCAEKGLTVVDSTNAQAAWSPSEGCTGDSRLVTCTMRPATPLTTPRQRVFRLVVRDDLFVILDAIAQQDDEWPALQEAIDSLRMP
jgi:hypothetical protein